MVSVGRFSPDLFRIMAICNDVGLVSLFRHDLMDYFRCTCIETTIGDFGNVVGTAYVVQSVLIRLNITV